MAHLSPRMSVITLNINNLNIPIKKVEIDIQTSRNDPICYSQEIHLKNSDIGRLKKKVRKRYTMNVLMYKKSINFYRRGKF